MENNNELFKKAKVVTEDSVKKLEEAERLDEINQENIRREREALEAEEKKRERLSKPAQIWITEKQVNIFRKKGELGLAGLNFGDRVLAPGDVVILEDEHLNKVEAEIVSIDKTSRGNDRVKVKSIKMGNL